MRLFSFKLSNCLLAISFLNRKAQPSTLVDADQLNFDHLAFSEDVLNPLNAFVGKL